jgi:tRNA dimethylallyltransferase
VQRNLINQQKTLIHKGLNMLDGKPIIGIIGATATGKTQLAVALAYRLNGEILSADSRQVYRGMDIGTGKDLDEYLYNEQEIPYHLIDIANPGEEYNVFRYQEDFNTAYKQILKSEKTPVLCGGSGLYIEVGLRLKYFPEVEVNHALRHELADCSLDELVLRLKSYGNLHNTTDTEDISRCIRAIEIQEWKKHNPIVKPEPLPHHLFGVKLERSQLRSNITNRLNDRLKNGMIEEVMELSNALSHEQLSYYGLEYKFVSQYIIGEISKDQMFTLLNTAIHQFAKRQETWFRKMEKHGSKIYWLDGKQSVSQKTEMILNQLNY